MVKTYIEGGVNFLVEKVYFVPLAPLAFSTDQGTVLPHETFGVTQQ
jgi:hypothetical protein